jgi:hypothetical protein
MSEMCYYENGKKKDRELHNEWLQGKDNLSIMKKAKYVQLAMKLGLTKDQAIKIYK